MSSFVQRLISFPANYIIIILIAFFYTLEYFQNTSFKFSARLDHLFNNLLFYFAVVAFGFATAILQVYCLQLLNVHQIGLFNQLNLPFTAKLIIGIICLDFTGYWFHRLSHKVPVLWRLHRVHHSDTNFDTSTFFRHHPIEVLVSAGSSLIASAVFGLDTIVLSVYVFILIPCMIAQHSRLRFPAILDKVFGQFVVTPNLHKLHHAQDQFYTDSNYADLFIVWDKLFGTFKTVPATPIVYGLPEFDDEKKQSFWFLIKSPFVNNNKLIKVTTKASNAALHPKMKG